MQYHVHSANAQLDEIRLNTFINVCDKIIFKICSGGRIFIGYIHRTVY